MKASCDREKLLHAFQMAAGVCPPRSPKPVLQNVKLVAAADRATLLATDLELAIRIEVAGFEVEAPGDLLLPVARFGAILRESVDERLLLESEGTRTLVRGSRSEFHLPTENPDEYPDVVSFEEERYHTVGARMFRELVRRTVFATNSESSRYALGGVLLELAGDQILAVATDGRRMAFQSGPAKAVGDHNTRNQTIVPTRAMQLIERALADYDGEIQLAARENDLLVKTDRATIYTRLLEGRFPKWRDVIPKFDQMTSIELAVGPFYSAVRQAAIVTDESHPGVDFQFSEGKVTLLARSAESGESRVEMPVAYEGREISIALDPKFLIEFLRVLETDATFTLYLRDAESAVVGSTVDGYQYVVMPLARE